MAIARFVMVACSGEHLSVRRSLTCFEALKLNLHSVNLLMVRVRTAKLRERGWNPTLQTGFTSSPNKKRKGSQERVKV